MSASAEAGRDRDPARRLTPSERLHEVTMAALQRQPSPPEHSLELTRNAKQQVQIALTVRAHSLAELEAEATATFDRLCAKYPAEAPASGGAA